MRLGKDLIGKPIYSVSDGRLVGEVKDLYLDTTLESMVGVYLGSEGLISRKVQRIASDSVVVYGVDAILVKNADAIITESGSATEAAGWLRRDKLQGREVDTTGGTKVATLGDVIINEAGKIVGFSLARVFVSGPVADHKAVIRDAVVDTGQEDGIMTIDLNAAEQQKLIVE